MPRPKPRPSRPSPKSWPPGDVQLVLDALEEAVIAADEQASIVYANPAAERLLAWPAGTLLGESLEVTLPEGSFGDWFPESFSGFLRGGAREVTGRKLPGEMKRSDGTRFPAEIVVSVVEADDGGLVLLGTVRSRDERSTRWAEITQRLLDTFTSGADVETAEEQVLAVLGTYLEWDLATLWLVEDDGSLTCRHVWIDPRLPAGAYRTARPSSTVSGATLPLAAAQAGRPLYVRELSHDERFCDGPAAAAGLVSAVAFPVAAQGALVGVVELLSTVRRESDPDLVALVRAVSGPVAELLSALRRASERERMLADLERSRQMQEFLLRASRVLADAADYRETLDRLAEVAVSYLADLCLIDVIDEQGVLVRVTARHADPSKASLAAELKEHFPPDTAGVHPALEVVRTARSRWSAEMSDDFLRATTRGERHFQVVKALGFESYVAVPLFADEGVLGAVTLVSAGSGRRFSEQDLALAEQLASQVASVVGRARRHERDHVASFTLQHSLLPDRLPRVEGMELAVRYRPASQFDRVGGDWYDVVAAPQGLALVVGDIEGHGLEAAVAMGRLRHAMAAFLSECAQPQLVLERLGRFAVATRLDRLATVLVALMDPHTGVTTIASAGHPPPIAVVRGKAVTVEVKPAPPIGIDSRRSPEGTVIRLDPGVLVMFTDGLVDLRVEDWDAACARMAAVVGPSAHLGAEPLADHLLATMSRAGGAASDDVALLVAKR